MNNKLISIFIKTSLISLILYFITGCKSNIDNWDSIFRKNNINGTFVLKNTRTGEIKIHNRKRADSLFLPASTFKILNSLIALETGVIKNENEIIKWDGKDKGYREWNKDHNMKSAIKVSCVWFYQELARRIGFNKMKKAIKETNYGNKKTGKNIDDFWLKGDIRITANQQIEFLTNLIENKLPFKNEYQEKVKEIIITDSTDNYIIHSKTGWVKYDKPEKGWIIGYVEKKDTNWVFALNIDINNKKDLKKRKKILNEILSKEKIINN